MREGRDDGYWTAGQRECLRPIWIRPRAGRSRAAWLSVKLLRLPVDHQPPGPAFLLTLDFLGFGLPDKPAWHTYDLIEQADIVQQTAADAELRLLTERAAGQLKKLDTAVASSGDSEVARFW